MSISNCTSKAQAKAYIEIYKVIKLNKLNVEDAETLLDLCKNDLKTNLNTSHLHIPELDESGFTYKFIPEDSNGKHFDYSNSIEEPITRQKCSSQDISTESL